jgi:uncharacterized protein (DUF488 family)
MPKGKSNLIICTIGHSTRAIEEFIHLLADNGVQVLVDIRTIPGSRKNPQFGQENLARSLGQAGLEYLHMAGLGGRRHTHKDSINTGWHDESFRGYADYMMSDQFRQALDELLQLCAQKRVAIMCAEAVPWRCHRFLVSDALLVEGICVKHIIGKEEPKDHKFCSFAHVEGKQIIYSGEQ